MSHEDFTQRGAFALYTSEQGYRVREFQKKTNADDAISADFQAYSPRYFQQFQSIQEALHAAGLKIVPAAA